MTDQVKTTIDNGIMTLTISRPEKKNALTSAMYSALSDGLEKAEKDASIKVVIFQGDGDSFTAGNDLADFKAQSAGGDQGENQASRFIRNLGKATKPLIAAVQGNAVGIGTTMLLHCDLVYVTEDAKLITPFVNLALIPEAASSMLLPARIGHARAYAMFALGEPMTAPAAVAAGLANAILPAAELRAKALASAEKITKQPSGSLRLTKTLMRDIEKISSVINQESDHFADRLTSAEAREAFTAFAEKRKPDFSKVQ